MSSPDFCELLQRDKTAVRSRGMAGPRPIFHAEIAQDLRTWRERRGWTAGEAVLRAKGKGLDLSVQQLRWVEEGRAKHPTAEVLKAVAAIYGIDYAPLAWRYVQANYGVSPEFGLADSQPLDAMQAAMLETLGHVPGALQHSVLALLRTLVAELETARQTTRTAGSGRGHQATAHTTPAGARRPRRRA